MLVEGVGVSFVRNDKARVVKNKKRWYVIGRGARYSWWLLQVLLMQVTSAQDKGPT